MMEIDDDDVLRGVAANGKMDYSVWPALLPCIVSRIDKIAHDDFPVPKIPPPLPAPSSILPSQAKPRSDETETFLPPLPSSPLEPDSTTSSQETNKENTPIATRTAAASAASAPIPPPADLPPGTLPPQITAMLEEITKTLNTFETYPPHTIQRLAELILTPKHHYRSLAAYLHALDRVVHVTSGLNIYPLPDPRSDIPSGSFITNGVPAEPSSWAAPGSDEALGGALLTPITWLQNTSSQTQSGSPQAEERQPASTGSSSSVNEQPEGEIRTESTETIDGPNGMGSIETVTVTVNGVSSMGARGVGVTQGELLRQEQRAGVVPVSQIQNHLLRSSSSLSPSPASAEDRETSATATEGTMEVETTSTATPNIEDEVPHARGPEEIGADDLGPQHDNSRTSYVGGPGVEMQGIDVEAAVGRKPSENRTSPEAKEESPEKMDLDTKAEAKPEAKRRSRSRSATPKREAEDVLEGSTSKKLKEDPEASVKTEGDDAKEGEEAKSLPENEN